MYPCQRIRSTCHSRRDFLQQAGAGFGALALSALLAGGDIPNSFAAEAVDKSPFAPKPTHFTAKAKSVIYLYMDGGPSQVDTFDPKPRLTAESGKPIKMHAPPTQFIPHDSPPKVLASPFKF